MAAVFEKVLAAPFFEFDGFDPKVSYQMVPVGETRLMSVTTDDATCNIVIDPPGIAHMRNFVFDKPAAVDIPRDFRARIPPNNRLKFELFGDKKGNTTIFLVDSKGKAFDTLTVSVKGTITKKVAMCRLFDIRRNCPFPPNHPVLIFPRLQQVFRAQANIQLDQHLPVLDVTVTSNLGDPIIMEKPAIRSAILNATPVAAFGADFIVYFTWDVFSLRAGQIVGQNFGVDCYVEFRSDTFQNAITAAHEIGHGLGLDHTGANSLMAGDGNVRTSLLQQFEIDTINQTDLTP